MTGFVIHALPVLRGILAIAPLPGSGGDYAADLEHLKDWRPAMVISMTTPAELAGAGAAKLGHDVMLLGTRWVHVPTPDHGVPDLEAARIWDRAEPVALSALRGGGRVLIHCAGGCGRSGMAALRLMIAAEEAPDDALERLRARRPGAVETSAQMRWALKGQGGAGGKG
ncbi:protein phosphatase [Pelagivirga sediminicola]|uniref:Protein phosphatase n=1 Tax=Pelagivirga sediminicola TaxID=2170575 RepID=A0A2T7G7M8_9RHOB|nr:protein-tyrosine phosphatase family protein [Pelagivirga sediminicola]PVA10431.1 protein phosphatase [Pelagivirga sediminicola]